MSCHCLFQGSSNPGIEPTPLRFLFSCIGRRVLTTSTTCAKPYIHYQSAEEPNDKATQVQTEISLGFARLFMAPLLCRGRKATERGAGLRKVEKNSFFFLIYSFLLRCNCFTEFLELPNASILKPLQLGHLLRWF